MSYLIFAVLIWCVNSYAQSPHGDLKGLDCAECHESSNWKISQSKVKFDHSKTGFKLLGQHKVVSCISCHNNLKFSGAQSNCNSCHKDVHQNSVGSECSTCHTPETWIVANSNELHQKSRFPLIGAHLKANCIQCHSGYPNLNFIALGINCADCHLAEYQATQNPNHSASGFSTDCLECHSLLQEKWSAEIFAHDFFPLTGGHKIQNCFSCHQQGSSFSGLSTDCYSCHKKDFDASSNPPHLENSFPISCKDCHTIQSWKPASFDHNQTQFPLTGAHVNAACINCHQNGYSAIPASCVSCHQTAFNASTNPNHSALGIPTDCQNCHTTSTGWKPATFPIHDNYYQLIGAHAVISNDCNKCHNGSYNNTPNSCYGCHTNDYNSTSNPPHASSGFSTDCVSCHSQSAWHPANWDHDVQYFPIYSGKHNGKWNSCADCHNVQSNYAVFSCIDCHEHEKTKMDDEHKGVNGYVYASSECLSCHPRGEKEGAFNHATSAFPLTGAHLSVECSQCHTNGYANTPTSCFVCHQTQYNASANPNHIVLSISTNCENCHSTNPDWKPALFPQHDQYFALLGAHAVISNDCNKCHNGSYTDLSNECISCHQNAYNTAINPNHTQAGISNACETCHNSNAWIPSSFNHASTGFSLEGKHQSTQCSSCHKGTTAGLNSLCISCHQNAYDNASNPNHTQAGISNACETCHNSNAWIPSSFNHASTGFSLEGKHQSTQCSSCHKGTTAGLNGLCFSCHQNEYNTAQNHVSQSFPTNCEMCHNSEAWNQTSFDHNNTNFQLTGAHITVACSNCHSDGYTNISTECSSCHLNNFNNTTNPNHTALNLSTQCESCHTTNPGWKPAEFAIHDNFFQLIGAHAAIKNECSSCHINGYSDTPADCYGCHQNDYLNTNDPPHQSSQFPTDCLPCHNQNSWKPASFDHDNPYFPIYSGKHRGKWDKCSDCHTNPADYSIFSCIDCHEHNQSKMNDKHKNVSGYAYDSRACYDCHPRGSELKIKPLQRIE